MIGTHRKAVATLLGTALVAWASGGCATTGDRGQPLVPTRFQTSAGPFVVFTNDPIPADSPVVRQLHALQTEFQRELDVDIAKVDPPIEVYLIGDRRSFEHFLTFYYPELPQRRAFFLASGPRRVIYTYVSDHLVIDVRHEAAHALLSAAYGDLPLWLDEGLAEYFERPGETRENPENLRRLPGDRAEGWTPDLARLETVKRVKDMTPRDYREAWAWVDLFLSGAPEDRKSLREYLGSAPDERGELAERISRDERDDSRERLIAHIEMLAARPAARKSEPKPPVGPTVETLADSVVRLQGAAVEAAPRSRPKRSLIRRFRDLVAGNTGD